MFKKSILPDSDGTDSGIDIPVVEMARGPLRQWIGSESLKTSLNLIYSSFPSEYPDSFGWQDRRLVCENLIMRHKLPEEVISSLLDIPRPVDEGPWLIAASPYFSSFAGPFWKAAGIQGILDAVKLVWSDYISSALEQNITLAELDCGLLIIPENLLPVSAGSSEPSAVQFENLPAVLKAIVTPELPKEAPLSQTYTFGKIYNRLIQPKDMFEYLQLLSDDGNSNEMRNWKNAVVGSGNDDSIRGSAILEMNEFLNRKSTGGRDVNTPSAAGGSCQIRQISGYASSPGIAEAPIWNPSSGSAVPDGKYILVTAQLSAENMQYLEGAAGLLEQNGGRGGPGAFMARESGIPAICEAREIFLLPDGVRVLLNGSNGIMTVISVR